MARLALSLGGAFLGAAIAGPQGARIGFAIGSAAGSILFTPDLPTIRNEGPRRGDLAPKGSSYDQAIPIGYGTVRLPGNCIWSMDIEERENVETQSTGGKGGAPSQTTESVTFSYYGTYAISYAEGEADDIIRRWANGKLIYDKSSSGSVIRAKGLDVRFYAGDEIQMPDGLIEADKGAGNVPAHRGLVYDVFDGNPLANYGNGRPLHDAEVTFSSTSTYPIQEYTFFTLDPDTEISDVFKPVYDTERKNVFIFLDTFGDTTRDQYLVKFTATGMIEQRGINTDNMYDNSPASSPTAQAYNVSAVSVGTNTGYLYFIDINATSLEGVVNESAIYRLNPDTLKISSAFPSDASRSTGVTTANTTGRFASLWRSVVLAPKTSSIGEFLVCVGVSPSYVGYTGNTIGILNAETMTYLWGDDEKIPLSDGTNITAFQGAAYSTSVEAIYIANPITDNGFVFNIYKQIVSKSGASQLQLFTTITGADFTAFGYTVDLSNAITPTVPPAQFGTTRQNTWVYDESTNALIGMFENVEDLPNKGAIVSIDYDTGSLNWVTPIKSGTLGRHEAAMPPKAVTGQNYVISGIWTDSRNRFTEIDKDSGEVKSSLSENQWNIDDRAFGISYDPDIDGYIVVNENGAFGQETKAIFYFERATGGGASLSSIVSDLCSRAGLLSSDIDVSDLSSINVPGYVIGRPMSVRAAIEPLSLAYFFDAVESDYQLKFIKRGAGSTLNIPESDLAFLEENTALGHDRIEDQELPMQINVSFMDKDRDYQANMIPAKRAVSPFPVMNSIDARNIEFPIVMTAQNAAQIAEKILYNSWVEREQFRIIVSWKYIGLDPTDVITITMNNGDVFTCRIITADFGGDMSVRMTLVAEEISNYTTSGISASTDFPPSEISGTFAKTLLQIDNLPLLRDIDDQLRQSSILYMQAAPLIQGSPWQGTTIYKSNDENSWSSITRIVNEMTYGTVEGILPAPSDVFAVDNISTLIIYPAAGSVNLDSISYDELLAGQLNVMLVGDEIINFQNVTDNGDGSFTLDTLLRGRRGTDPVADAHGNNESFYLMNSSTVKGVSIPLSEINTTLYFKAVSDGSTIEEASTIELIPTGDDLKPYALVNPVRSDMDSPNDTVISADRRSRIDGGNTGSLLNEDTEEYEAELLDSSFSTVNRTFTGLTTPAFTYTAAQKTSDGFSGGTLYVRMYQISAQVDRGKTYDWTLEE